VRKLSLLCLWLLVGTPCPAAPSAGALLTILDGRAVLTIGARSVEAAEGLRVPDATIVETAGNTALLRLEWPDGQVVDFGPQTRAMIQPGRFSRRGESAPAFYLLSGWAKQRADGTAAHRGHVTPQVDVQPARGVSVTYASPERTTWVFAETGTASLVERPAGAKLTLASGQSYVRDGLAPGDVTARPDAELLKRLPRAFRDLIPLRLARFEGKEVAARPLPPPDYKAVQDWLSAEAPLRRDFPRRFGPLLREPGFRASVAARLSSHPEWERILYPERFIVRPAPAVTGVSR
jgi:hypothetical protein